MLSVGICVVWCGVRKGFGRGVAAAGVNENDE